MSKKDLAAYCANSIYKGKVQELREHTRLYDTSKTVYIKVLNNIMRIVQKQKRVEQLQGACYGWQAIYEKSISEGYYK